MKKLILFGVLVLTSFNLSAQVEFDLTAPNVQKYIGKVDQTTFEKEVGEPLTTHNEMGVTWYMYNVISTMDNQEQAISCFYRNDGKLSQLKFTHPYPDSFLLSMAYAVGVDKNKTVIRERDGEVYYHKMVAKGIEIVVNNYQKVAGIWHGDIRYGIKA